MEHAVNPSPTAVETLEDYQLLVTLENGERRIFDVSPLLEKRMYKPLRNKGLFSLAKTDGMCVYWNDAIDLCPDRTYEDSVPIL